MERALELPQDVEALHALVLDREALIEQHRVLIAAREREIAEQREELVQLAHQYPVLVKLVYGRSSEKREPASPELAAQGHLFLAEIAAEAERLAEAHHVVATVEVPAHTRAPA